jgi:hypothetical protein
MWPFTHEMIKNKQNKSEKKNLKKTEEMRRRGE